MHVTIIALDGAVATTVSGPFDIFQQAGIRWHRIFNTTPEPYFNVEIVSMDGEPVECRGGLMLIPHQAMQAIEKTELIMISGCGDLDSPGVSYADVITWLRRHHDRGALIASICTGAFVLAETGLLKGKTVTTHWGFVSQFMRKYPDIRVCPQRTVIDADDILTSGGVNAGLDLSLYLVEKICGREIALQCAKTIVHDLGRRHQSPYSVFRFQKDHSDQKILDIQEWLESNYATNLDYSKIASNFGLTRRTLERRFKLATGQTPLAYRQRVRVEAAKIMLENSEKTIDEIAYAVGYEDTNSFRKIFMRNTSLRPSIYRSKFNPSAQMNES